RAGADDADMVIAATHSDEVNMVTCQVAHSVFNIPRKIARLRSQSYLDAIYSDLYRRDHLPIDVVISPEKEVAEAALRRLQTPAAFETEFFFGGEIQMLGITLDDKCPVLNTPLKQLSDLFSTLSTVVVAIRRQGTLFVPSSGDQLFSGDSCYIFIQKHDVQRALEVFGKTTQAQDRVVIIGGGNVGFTVAKHLENRSSRIRAKVIEIDRDNAEHAAELLEKTIVLHGDGLDAEMLAEANIERSDAILTLTDDDKTNLLAAIRAKSMGCPLAICLINDPSMVPLLHAMGIDAYVNPRATTVSSILRHIRHGRVRGVYSIGDAEGEVIEAQVMSTSTIAGQYIRDIEFPEGVLVGAVRKGTKILKPSGSLRIEDGDHVVLFALAADVGEVERLLQVTVDFF
ncbi:MAG: Trk system potassium transporter TrkA, partial [Planktomarina sp.]|nr:Trk system potassium transporter TrkA [Planktomarina sp.]